MSESIWGRLHRVAGGAALGCFGLTCLPAQTPSAMPNSNRDLADIPLEQLAQIPVESVTGASRYEQLVRRAPASVTVLTEEEILNHDWRTVAEALQTTPGFHLRSDRFYDYIGNRGFTRAYDYNSRTLILINGHRVNDSIYQQGSVGTDFLLDTEMIKRIEVIRGPGSSVYGSSAFYGAVNIIPKTPSDFAGGQVSTRLDTQGGWKARATVGDRTPAGLEYLVSTTWEELDGENPYPISQAWRDLTRESAREAHDQDGTKRRQLFSMVRFRDLEWETGYGRRHKDVPPDVYWTAADRRNWAIDERAYSLLRHTWNASQDTTLYSKFGYDFYRYSGVFYPFRAGYARFLPFARAHSLQGEVRLRHRFLDRHTLLVGAEHQQNLQQRLGRINADTGEVTVGVNTHSHFTSPFAQVDWQLLEQLFASTGLRYDNYSTGEKRATPRLGLMWDVREDTYVKLIYGESFRVPNVDERYTQEYGFIPNGEIGPEANDSFELVINHRPVRELSLEANGFRTLSRDLILTADAPDIPETKIYVNRQVIRTEGVELGATAFLKSDIQIRTSATLQRAVDEGMNGQEIYDAPRRLYKLSLSAPLATPRLRGSLELLHTSSRLDDRRFRVPGYTMVNASLRLKSWFRNWDISLSCANLTNVDRLSPKNEGVVTGMPRIWSLRATRDF